MFSFVKNDNGDNFPIIEQKKSTSATYAVGDALIVDASTGYVKKCGATDKPSFICAQQVDATTTAGDEISVNPVYAGQTWKSTFSADASALKAGAKVTLANAQQVTATTTGGVATLVADGKASSGEAIVKFI